METIYNNRNNSPTFVELYLQTKKLPLKQICKIFVLSIIIRKRICNLFFNCI